MILFPLGPLIRSPLALLCLSLLSTRSPEELKPCKARVDLGVGVGGLDGAAAVGLGMNRRGSHTWEDEAVVFQKAHFHAF